MNTGMSRTKGAAALFILGAFALIYLLEKTPARGLAQVPPQRLEPAGGGAAPFLPTDEITDEQRKDIHAELEFNMMDLRLRGMLAPASPDAVSLSWPVRKAAGVTDFGVDGISNYVDHNPAYPNLVLDWNCGARTYDQASGYNHKGIDIFNWPFSWKKMDNSEVEIVAAAAGTIIAKHDGNFDRNCTFNSSFWNAVYVRHSDNSIAWYGHMKNGSLTSKSVGETVELGEKLGVVGSSGNSTGPHLHFELYNSANQLQDPFQGTCNLMNTFSWWTQQEPYRTPRINRLTTQSGPPVFSQCPNTNAETTNEKGLFRPGQSVITAAYYRDQGVGQESQYSLVRPDGSVFRSWTHPSPNTYNASYWFWNSTLPADAEEGTWNFRVEFNSQTYYQPFVVDADVTVSGRVLDPSGRGLRNAVVTIVSPQNVTRSVQTGSLGYYAFSDVRAGHTYNLRVASKRFRFAAKDLVVGDDLANVDFSGVE